MKYEDWVKLTDKEKWDCIERLIKINDDYVRRIELEKEYFEKRVKELESVINEISEVVGNCFLY